jgi:DNA repair exonuclease SbcCD nuclease subunit
MTEFRFIHSSDLHLGRRFASLPQASDDNLRGRLMEARFEAIAKLAAVARAEGAGHILLAGDTFDTPAPSAAVLRQALAAMRDEAGVDWWLLPGNHDNLREAEPLWQQIARQGGGTIHPLLTAQPVQIAPGVTLLPCPITHRDMGCDPSADLVAMPSPDGDLRLGLAHGGVVDFTESGAHIPPDRDRSARLDYLALGDWHGGVEVSARTRYSGSPEQDRFTHGQRGHCLSVILTAPGQTPQIRQIETGKFLWQQKDCPLLPGQDAAEALNRLLPEAGRRAVLLRILATGRCRLPDQAALTEAAAQAAPEFAFFDLRQEALALDYETADLDEIDQGGALRLAANALRDAAENTDASAQDRAVAGAALGRLYAYVRKAAE